MATLTQEPTKKRLKLSMQSLQEQLHIIVGCPENKAEFFILKRLICHHSDFFKLACDTQWESGRTNLITLEDDNPETFAIFLAWVQTGRVDSAENYIEVAMPTTSGLAQTKFSTDISAQWDQLCACFVQGEILLAPAFQNYVLDLIIANSKMQQNAMRTFLPGEKSLQYIYENSVAGSPLRQFVVDSFIASPSPDIPHYDFAIPCFAEYLVDLATYAIQEAKTSRLRGKPCDLRVPWKNDPCRYHIHHGRPDTYSCTPCEQDRVRFNYNT